MYFWHIPLYRRQRTIHTAVLMKASVSSNTFGLLTGQIEEGTSPVIHTL